LVWDAFLNRYLPLGSHTADSPHELAKDILVSPWKVIPSLSEFWDFLEGRGDLAVWLADCGGRGTTRRL